MRPVLRDPWGERRSRLARLTVIRKTTAEDPLNSIKEQTAERRGFEQSGAMVFKYHNALSVRACEREPPQLGRFRFRS
jgi:hypothetical protein